RPRAPRDAKPVDEVGPLLGGKRGRRAPSAQTRPKNFRLATPSRSANLILLWRLRRRRGTRTLESALGTGEGGNAMSAIRRLSAALAVSIFSAGAAVAEPTTIGAVDKVQAQVSAAQAGQTRELAVNSDLYFRDRCRSGDGARLQATLGEHATLVIDEFVYDPTTSRGKLAVRIAKGAFLYVGGLIERAPGAKVLISTPAAAIGVRGTTVWGGPIDKGFGVLALSGE